jgi:type IV pilus assembly protein PilM
MRTIGRARTAIGVDIGSRNIKAAQLRMSGGRHCIVALSSLPRTKVGQEVDREELINVRSVLRRQGFRGTDVVLAAPEEKLLRGIFEVPRQVSGAPVAQIARMELSRMHNVPPNSFEMVCWEPSPAGESTKSARQTVAVACPHSAADALLDVFEESGFSVKALDLHSAAAARICASLTVPRPAITSILDLGWSSTKLLLVCDGKIVYDRFLTTNGMEKLISRLREESGIIQSSAYKIVSTVGFGDGSETGEFGQEFTQIIRKKLSNHFDIILDELKAPFEYVSHQYRSEGVKRLLLIGGGAKISGLAKHFEAALGIEVMSVAPSDVVESSPQIMSKASNPAMMIAVGLAQFAGE